MTLAEIYLKYSAPDARTGCDKGTVHSYVEVYEELFAPYRETARRVVEIGIMGGHSLRMWEEYFPAAEVWGVDLCDQPFGGLADLRPMIAEGTHKIALLDATDPKQVEEVFGDMTFDVIIDDASHQLSDQSKIWNNFKPRLSPGGIYVIEDIEDIDRDRPLFLTLGCRVLDRRHIKNRFDDVLVVYGGPK